MDMRVFHQADWTDYYGDVKEAIPDNTPEPQGKLIILRAFVDSDHANDKVRCRSHTGFCCFINMACIIWYTKRQVTVESAVFVAEFVPSHGNFMRIPIQTQDDGSDLPICMEITCQPFRTLNALSLSLASSPTVFVIMLLERQWQWESCQLDMSRQMRILLIC